MAEPLVSILVPAFNAQEWICEALQSAVAQTWLRKEIIVVDDGSRDMTAAVAREFASPSVNVISQANGGASAARNAALRVAQGDYIQWLDSDDVLAVDKIERQMERVLAGLSRRTLLTSAWARFYYRIEKAQPAANSLWRNLDPVDWMIGKLGENGWMAIETWLISRELAEAVGPWDMKLSLDDDGEYVSRLVCASDGVLFEPRAISFVRQANLESLSRGRVGSGNEESQFRSMKLQVRNLLGLEDSGRTRSACCKYLQRWLAYFYPNHPQIVKEAEELATELGGTLTTPRLREKYVLIQKVIGWGLAQELSRLVPQIKGWIAKHWDWTLAQSSRKSRLQPLRVDAAKLILSEDFRNGKDNVRP